jgi:hypothetical protein
LGITLPGKDARSPRLLVYPEQRRVRSIFGNDGDRKLLPIRMLPEEELEWKRRDINTCQPDHGKSPDVLVPGRAFCL